MNELERKIQVLEHQRSVLIDALRKALEVGVGLKWISHMGQLQHPNKYGSYPSEFREPHPFRMCHGCYKFWDEYRPQDEEHYDRCKIGQAKEILKAADKAKIQ